MRKIILFTSVFLSIWGCATKEIKPELSFNDAESDQSLVGLLIQKGSNANKEHRVSFIIDCETEKQVTEITSKAKIVGFDEDYIFYSYERKLWSFSLSASMKLNEHVISAYRAKLMHLITMNSCIGISGVGWGATVIK